MQRRNFLKTLPAGLAASPFVPEPFQNAHERLQKLGEDLNSISRQEVRWRRVREHFRLNPGLTHLNCGSLGATPDIVIDAVGSQMREIEGSPVFKTFSWGGEQMEMVRTHAANFIGADPSELAFTHNTTEGMNAVATGLHLEPGDQVLTTNHEHGGGMVCWQHLRKHRGIEIVYIEMPTPLQDRHQIVELIQTKITPRTKVCSLCHIDTITGIQLPLAEIAAITRPRDIVLVCDGAQAPGMIPVDVKSLGVDTYALSGHKWMLTPKGNGLLYIRKEMQDRIQPAFLHSGYQAYTASSGTRDIARILGFGAAIRFLETVGLENIRNRCNALGSYLRERLEALNDLTPLTPTGSEVSCGIQTWALHKGDAGEMRSRLRNEYEIHVKAAQGTYAYCEEDDLRPRSYNALRFSTHIFNRETEIDHAVDVLQRLLAEV